MYYRSLFVLSVIHCFFKVSHRGYKKKHISRFKISNYPLPFFPTSNLWSQKKKNGDSKQNAKKNFKKIPKKKAIFVFYNAFLLFVCKTVMSLFARKIHFFSHKNTHTYTNNAPKKKQIKIAHI